VKHIDLFSGIGGFALACRWAGIQTVAFCEIDPYCQKVLEKNFDAKVAVNASEQGLQDGTKEQMGEPAENEKPERRSRVPIHPDIFTFDGTKYAGAFILTGGFPCQPFSCTGKRRGKEDDRFIWPEMLRVISEARPTWVIGENVAGIVKMELDNCISDLEGLSYSVQAFIIPACAVDAPHRRDRVWIVAHSSGTNGSGDNAGKSSGNRMEMERDGLLHAGRREEEYISNPRGQDVADTVRFRGTTGLSGQVKGDEGTSGITVNGSGECCRWTDEGEWFALTGMGRVASRIPSRVDRLKSLGNAIVPQTAYEIIKSIVEVS
jgi:DNA (cytosine-5)-methyltransferase 1